VSCSGFTKTLNIDLPWASGRFLTSNFGGFGSNDALVVQLHPPGGWSSGYGSVSLAEYGGTAVSRASTISTSPCDFSKTSASILFNVSTGSSLGYSLQVGGSQAPWIFLMQPGVTYYLNVKNTGCPTGSQCNMFLDFTKPAGT
jgi:hypothetical protein